MKSKYAIGGAVAAAIIIGLGLVYGPDLWAYNRFESAIAKHNAEYEANGGAWPHFQESCNLCHGPDGQSKNANYASLAAQPEAYIERQLHAFANGSRSSPYMQSVAVNLSEDQIRHVASFYSRQTAEQNERPAANSALDDEGKALVTSGNCVACHGDTLMGSEIGPRLAGQGEVYLTGQLRAFKHGDRTDPAQAMTGVAGPLTDRQIDALGHYLAGLTPHVGISSK